MIDLRKPNITGGTEAAQLAQIRSYLFQLVGDLQYALDKGSPAISAGKDSNVPTTPGGAPDPGTPEAQDTFNSIKSLIIKSTDIVNAYYTEMSKRFDGDYVAQSEFGEFREQTQNDLEINSTAIEQQYKDIQQIISDLSTVTEKIIAVDAYIKTGLLYYDAAGVPIYGLEIGQTNVIDGVENFNKFARFTSDRLSFFDQNSVEVAYFSDYKMYIRNAQITGTLGIGGYVLKTTNGLAFSWEGGAV